MLIITYTYPLCWLVPSIYLQRYCTPWCQVRKSAQACQLLGNHPLPKNSQSLVFWPVQEMISKYMKKYILVNSNGNNAFPSV